VCSSARRGVNSHQIEPETLNLILASLRLAHFLREVSVARHKLERVSNVGIVVYLPPF